MSFTTFIKRKLIISLPLYTYLTLKLFFTHWHFCLGLFSVTFRFYSAWKFLFVLSDTHLCLSSCDDITRLYSSSLPSVQKCACSHRKVRHTHCVVIFNQKLARWMNVNDPYAVMCSVINILKIRTLEMICLEMFFI